MRRGEIQKEQEKRKNRLYSRGKDVKEHLNWLRTIKEIHVLTYYGFLRLEVSRVGEFSGSAMSWVTWVCQSFDSVLSIQNSVKLRKSEMCVLWSKRIMEVVKFYARALSRFFRSLVNTKGAATLQKLSLIHFFLKDLLMVYLKSEEYMHIACQFKKTFKTIFHLLNIVPLWISFKEENGVKNLQKKYFNSFFYPILSVCI